MGSTYSAFFNALAVPAPLLPLAGAAIEDNISLETVFVTAFVAAIAQLAVYRQLLQQNRTGDRHDVP